MYFTGIPWLGFPIGLVALVAAWFGGERFIQRQVEVLARTSQKLAEGDLSTRTGLSEERGKIGQLARSFDSMAATLEQRLLEREKTEKNLLNRSFQLGNGITGQFFRFG